MKIPAWAECFIGEFWLPPTSILVDPLDVAFAISIYINLHGRNPSHKMISQQIQIN
jgi:hypothetical protein